MPGFDDLVGRIGSTEFQGLIVTGNYPSEWVTEEFASACQGKSLVLIDTLPNRLTEQCEVFLPGATWVEKAGSFVNADERIQAFEQAIPPLGQSRSEAQIALDILAILSGEAEAGDAPKTIIEYPDAMPGQVPTAMETAAPIGERYNAAMIRQRMASEYPALRPFVDEIHTPTVQIRQEADMEMVEL